MDCDSCGRYRPSSEIVPLRAAPGRDIVMACARCRRLLTELRAADRGFLTIARPLVRSA